MRDERRCGSYKPREDPDEELHHFRRLDYNLTLQNGSVGHIERLPPGVRCVQPNGDYFLHPSATSWAGLVGYSAAFGFLTAAAAAALQSSFPRRRRWTLGASI
jgi:hypothetical protein